MFQGNSHPLKVAYNGPVHASEQRKTPTLQTVMQFAQRCISSSTYYNNTQSSTATMILNVIWILWLCSLFFMMTHAQIFLLSCLLPLTWFNYIFTILSPLLSQSDTEKDFRTQKWNKTHRNLAHAQKDARKARNWATKIRTLQKLVSKGKLHQSKVTREIELYTQRFGPLLPLDSQSETLTGNASWEILKSHLASQGATDQQLKFMTSVGFLAMALASSTNVPNFVASVMQFVNSEFAGNAGVIADIWAFLMELNNSPTIALEDYDALDSQSENMWFVDMLRDVKSNWSAVKTCDGFPKVHKFLCALVTLGLVRGDNLHWDIQGVKMFELDTKAISMDALDIVDATINLSCYLMESGTAAFASKSLRPFLFSNKTAMEIEDSYTMCTVLNEHVMNGNLEKVAKVAEKDYEKMLDTLLGNISRELVNVQGPVRQILLRKRENAMRYLDKLIESRLASGARAAPFAPVILGDSNIGKTSFTQIIAREIAARCGFSGESRSQCVIQGNDKYWSSYKGYTEVVIIDDFGNTDPKYMQEDEGNKQILIKNNQMCYAPKAEAGEKGRILVDPKLMLINTNNYTMLSEMSINAYSRFRRGDVYLEVEVKEKYRRIVDGVSKNEIDSDIVNKEFCQRDECGNPIMINGHLSIELPTLPDLWDVKLMRPYMVAVACKGDHSARTRKKSEAVQWETLKHDFGQGPTDCDNLSILDALDAVSSRAEKFYIQQKGYVDMNKRLDVDFVPCEHGCGKSTAFCTLRPCATRTEKLDSQSLFLPSIASVSTAICSGVISKIHTTIAGEANKIETTVTGHLLKAYYKLDNSYLYRLSTWLPDSWMDTTGVRMYIKCFYPDKLKAKFATITLMRLIAPVLFTVLSLYSLLSMLEVDFWVQAALYYLVLMLGVGVLLACYEKYTVSAMDSIMEDIHKERSNLPDVVRGVRENWGSFLMKGAIFMVIARLAVNLYKDYKMVSQASDNAQSLLRPQNVAELETRFNLPNDWVSTHKKNVDCKEDGKTIDWSHLTDRTNNNLYTCEFHGASVSRTCSLVLCNGLLLVPKHSITETKADFIKLVRGKWLVEIPLDNTNMYSIPGKDLVLVYSAKIQGKDLVDYLREKDTDTGYWQLVASSMRFIYRDPEGVQTIHDTEGKWSSGVNSTKGGYFPGWYYNLPRTFDGSCGSALLVKEGKAHRLGGVHLCGTGTRAGGGSINTSDVANARKHFSALPDISAEGVLQSNYCNVDAVDIGGKMDETSPLNFIESSHHHTYVGPCKGSAKFYSDVRPSLITETVTEVTGCPNNYGPPRVKPWWKPYFLDLEKRSSQPIGFKIGELNKAAQEYVADFTDMYKKVALSIRKTIRTTPLTREEVLFGIPEYKFIDRMNFGTSIGFPLTGAKKKHCEMEGEEVLDFKPWVWKEVDEVENILRAGYKAYQPFKTSLKDEITKQVKDDGTENTKVRVFTCAPITLQVLIRKYYLPVAALLSRFPLDSNIAVGINASGPDFDELIRYLDEYGKDSGFVAGDFSKYDLGMSADAILAAFKVMSLIGKTCLNYTAEDVYIMDMIANEVANPTIAYNGDMIQMTGSNPSGQNMTVYINSIVNDIYHRCVHMRLSQEHKISTPYRKMYRLTTYGDDSLGAAKKGFSKIMNFNTIHGVFESVGIKYTPADKSESSTDTVPLAKVDFLKRKPVLNEKLGIYMGALDFGSIIKSLHCNASTTLPPDTASSVNLDGSIREMFNHGETAYEQWRAKVRTIAERHNLTERVSLLETPYQAYLERYQERYMAEKSNFVE
jgi:hypothetical protein